MGGNADRLVYRIGNVIRVERDGNALNLIACASVVFERPRGRCHVDARLTDRLAAIETFYDRDVFRLSLLPI